MHSEHDMYVPELIFGHLLTSSNYDDTKKKVTGGRNGYGAKLTNIFSTQFTIETSDSDSNKKFKQVRHGGDAMCYTLRWSEWRCSDTASSYRRCSTTT